MFRLVFVRIAFLAETGLDPEDIIYASFPSGIVRRPYCVVADRKAKAIAVVVRGTFALEDAVTDLTIKPTELDGHGTRFGFDGKSEYAHSGMLASADWIYADLEKNGIMDDLLVGDSCRYPGYKLYVVGHSLGAGCAGLLGLMLKKKYELSCLCFEPPGCVMTKNTSDYCQSFTTSYVLGSDIVPRLSLQAVEHVRDSIIGMVARTKIPKHQVISPGLLCSKGDGETCTDRVLHRRESVPDSSFYRDAKEFWTYQHRIKEERGERDVRLLPPGKIVHLVETSESTDQFGRLFAPSAVAEPYTAVWAKSEDFFEIQLASTYMSDHYPGKVAAELERIAANGFSPTKKDG